MESLSLPVWQPVSMATGCRRGSPDVMVIRGRPAQLPAASGPPAAQIFGHCSSISPSRTSGRPRRNYKSQHAPRRRACRPFPAADAREQVVVFMRRHWRLEPGRRHGDNRCGRAEEALPSGRYPGRRSGECGGRRLQLVPSGIAPGGCLLAVSSVLTLSGDLGWRARPGGREARARGLQSPRAPSWAPWDSDAVASIC